MQSPKCNENPTQDFWQEPTVWKRGTASCALQETDYRRAGKIATHDSRDDCWKKDQPITLPGRVILFFSVEKTFSSSRGHGSGMAYFIEMKKEGGIRENAS